MPEQPHTEKLKKNKGSLFASVLSNKKAKVLIFVIVFATVGAALLWRSFAEDTLLSASNDIILEMSHDHAEVGDGALLVPAEALPFRLYGNGLAVCGEYDASDASHTAQYYAKSLNRQQIQNFLASAGSEQFAKLNTRYVSDPSKALAHNAKVITYNTAATTTQVTVFDKDTAAPAAYTNTESAITKLCSGMHSPYVTDNIKVRTKVVDVKLVDEEPVKGVPSEIETPVAAENIHVQQNIDGGKANQIGQKSATKKGKKFYKNDNNEVIQVVTSQQLPDATQKTPTNTQKTNKLTRLFSQPKAYANSFGTVRFARFCATDVCDNVEVGGHMSNVRDWYGGQTGKTFDLQDIGTIYGSQPASYYRSADASVTFSRVFADIDAKGLFKSNSPIQLISGMNLGAREFCGIATLPSTFDYQKNLALTDYSVPAAGYTCTNNGFDYVTIAHELGHNLTLAHTTALGQAGGIMSYDYHCTWPACGLHPAQVGYIQPHPLLYTPANKQVGVAGILKFGGRPMAGARVETCIGQTPATNGDGIYLFLVGGSQSYCIRGKGTPTGVSSSAINNRPENRSSKTYEYQLAGDNCYHYCQGSAYTWDMNPDIGLDIHFAEAKAIALKPGSTQGQRIDSWGRSSGFGGATNASGIMYRDWDIVKSVAIDSSNRGYILDGYGGLHPVGGATSASGASYWSGWDIARDVKLLPSSTAGYVLTGLGSLHRFNGAAAPNNTPGLPGDLAKKFVIKNDATGGYILDAYGGLHPFGIGGSAPPPFTRNGPYWLGWDIARSVVLNPAGTKGYVLDGFGGIHPFRVGSVGLPPTITNAPYWSGWDIARDIVITDWTTAVPTGYTLDGFGGMNKFGG